MASTTRHSSNTARKSPKGKRRKPLTRPDPRPDHPALFTNLLREALTEPGIISSAYRAFHPYSLGNQLLAASQLLERGLPISPIESFRGWQRKGRSVRAGEKALRLFMPMTIHKLDRDEATGEEQEIRYQFFQLAANWFSLEQTEGATWAPQTDIPGWDLDMALPALNIREVRFSHLDGNCQGYAAGRQIAINPLAVLPHKTRFHELAHIVLGHTVESAMQDDARIPRNLREVEAEGVAYLLCSLLELPGKVEARGYLQAWLGDEELTEQTARRIFATADRILKAGQPKRDRIGQWDAVMVA